MHKDTVADVKVRSLCRGLFHFPVRRFPLVQFIKLFTRLRTDCLHFPKIRALAFLGHADCLVHLFLGIGEDLPGLRPGAFKDFFLLCGEALFPGLQVLFHPVCLRTELVHAHLLMLHFLPGVVEVLDDVLETLRITVDMRLRFVDDVGGKPQPFGDRKCVAFPRNTD